MKSLFIGLDLGTSSVKAGLYDRTGQELAMAREPLSIRYPEPGWAEQDPREWWLGIQKALQRVVQTAGADRVQAVGLSAQCPGHVLINSAGEPVGQAIIWRDRRAQAEAAWLAQHVDPHEAESWVGSPSLGDATMPPARLLWLKQHRRVDWKRSAKVLQPKDFIGLQLTGKPVTDRNTAFLLAHPVTAKYHPDLLGLLGIEEAQLPQVQEPTSMLGTVTGQAARLTGLLEGTPVFVGTIDAYCDTLAGGGFIPGQAVDVAGTSEIISLGTTAIEESQGVFLASLDGSAHFLCGPTQVGGSLLDWLAKAFYPEMGAQVDYSMLESQASAVPAGADGLVFLPYLHGERAPIWDPKATGAFLGITSDHGRGHFARAVYEGVGYAVRHVLEACERAGGQRAERLIICGGGSGSRFWNEIKAGILQKPVFPLMVKASTCLGAAMLSTVGAGEYPNLEKAWRGMSRLAEEIRLDASLAERYNQRYDEYRRAYPALQTVCRERHEVRENAMTNRYEIQLMVQVARLYYETGMNQEQIAKKLGTTRQNISRLLTAAREEGIVHISIYDPTPVDPGVREQLMQTFGLQEVVLTNSEGIDAGLLRSHLGLTAAEHLASVQTSGSVVGIGWGRTLYEAVNALPHTRNTPVHVIPMIGGIGDMSPFFQVNELARRMADAFGGTFRYIYAPAFTQDAAILESLERTREVEQLVDLWKRLNMAVIGIGHVEFQQISSMFFADHVSPGVLAQLEAKGAVGDICGRFFNITGEPVSAGAGVIGITLEQLRDVPEVIAIAGGMEKARAILGSLRGGFIKTLVTDLATARTVLHEHTERR